MKLDVEDEAIEEINQANGYNLATREIIDSLEVVEEKLDILIRMLDK
jgi:hypothetical protein